MWSIHKEHKDSSRVQACQDIREPEASAVPADATTDQNTDTEECDPPNANETRKN